LKKLESSSNLKQQTILGLLNSEDAKQEALNKDVLDSILPQINQQTVQIKKYLVEIIDQITKIKPSSTTISACESSISSRF
jgi:hypothetical protein